MRNEKQVWLPKQFHAGQHFFRSQALEHAHNNSVSSKTRREVEPKVVCVPEP